jgi:ketosteroid isomerase-like protein
MSRENVEVLQRAWDAWDRGDPDAAFEVFAPDVEWDVSRDIWGAIVGGGRYIGIEGVQQWLNDLLGAWETFEMKSGEVLDAGGDAVVTELHARGKGRRSGIEVEHHPAAVATFHGGKVTRMVWFPGRQEALEAAGLSE